MLRLKEGDSVRICSRPATPQDVKLGLYFNHYSHLTGTIFKIYGKGETAQAAIDIDIESLPEDIAKRHQETRDSMLRTMNGERTRSNPADDNFRLRYVILVAMSDLARQTVSRLSRNGHAELAKSA
jgi:hypothetical protein